MYNSIPFTVAIYLFNSILSIWYIQKLLRAKYRNLWITILWTSIYFVVQYAASEMAGIVYPLNVAGRGAICVLTFFVLSSLFFYGDMAIRLFLSCSFVAGSEIVRFISSAVFSVLSDFFHNILFWLVNDATVFYARHAAGWIEISIMVMLLICILVQFALLFLYLHIIVKQCIETNRHFFLHEKLFLILPGFTVLCIAITLRLVVISVESGISVIIYDRIPATKFWIPFICLLLLGMILSSVYLFQKMLQGGEEERKRMLLENQIAQMQGEVAEIQDIYADMRSLRHDLRGHLANISALIKEKASDNDKLPEYIGKMETTLNRLDFPIQTGNPITDVIIRRRVQEARKKQIPFRADFRYPVGQQIDAYDIGIILNNALANAIEACSHIDGTTGIMLRSYMKGNLFFMEVENDFVGEIVWVDRTGLPASSKENGPLHGIGLSSIRRCAQKYNGDIDIDISHTQGKSRFQLTVMMCCKDFTPENR